MLTVYFRNAVYYLYNLLYRFIKNKFLKRHKGIMEYIFDLRTNVEERGVRIHVEVSFIFKIEFI